ncbi:DUF4810 domain-containing protein [Nitrosospira multiformis]|uniref:DUF4810 domain-containing protein n=1 Tax=Nitrosospira multiformis TaxID=1231 RepID=UPI00089D0445|nr:DUF4810 domain-containing protein [Nitrosospira multiformis]SEA50876.1 hypothetical protein SAMN05216411_11116 [Nitrosospira multiformis]
MRPVKALTRPLAAKVFLKLCLSGLLASSLAGCAGPSIYHWGKFEDGLHERYVGQNHAEADVYLFETISAAEQQNLRVPPGAYADYGFVLFKRGDREGAISYFEKERRMFPESSAFMTKLIERVQQKEKEAVEKPQTNATVNTGAKP